MTQQEKDKLEHEFWLMWGLAPKETPKYKKGIEVLAFLLEKVEAKESEMSIKAHHIWLYLDQLQKAPGGNVSVEEWNLLETIKEKIDETFFTNSHQHDKNT